MFVGLAFALNCFGTQVTTIYNVQDGTATLTSTISPLLSIMERQTCNMLDAKDYTITIKIGEARFLATNQIFNSTAGVSLTAKCQEGYEEYCTQSYIKSTKLATFELTFREINHKIEGAVGWFKVRWFDRTACYSSASVKYSISGQNSYIQYLLKPLGTCVISPSSDCLILEWFVDGISVNRIEDSFLTFQEAREGFSNFVNRDDYMLLLTQYTVSCHNQSGNGLDECIKKIKKQVRDQLLRFTMELSTTYETNNIDPTTGQIITRQNQLQISVLITSMDSDMDNGCFSQQGAFVTFFEGSIRRQNQIGELGNCSHKAFRRMFDYNRVEVEYGVVENANFTGRRDQIVLQYNNTDYPYGSNIDGFFSCNKSQNYTECVEATKHIREMRSEGVVFMDHIFHSQNNSFVNKLNFKLVWEDSPFPFADLLITNDQMCIVLPKVAENVNYRVSIGFKADNINVEIREDMVFHPDVADYCLDLSESDQASLEMIENSVSQLEKTLQFNSLRMQVREFKFRTRGLPIPALWISVALVVSCVGFMSKNTQTFCFRE